MRISDWSSDVCASDLRAFRIQGLEHLHHFLAMMGVEVAGRLVRQDQFRLGDERAGDGDTLLLTAGKLARPVPGAVANADLVHHLVGAALALAGGDVVIQRSAEHTSELQSLMRIPY